IPFDEPADLVAISVETYTARRAYQIASEYRRRGVSVVMGGFHATLCPHEVAEYADAVVVGEAEEIWPPVIDDFRHGTARKFYRALIPLKSRWVSQSSINAAHDEEFLELLARSGCMGVLIGFESIQEQNLAAMNKSFNTMRGGFEVALANLRRFGIRVYGTFIFGYD